MIDDNRSICDIVRSPFAVTAGPEGSAAAIALAGLDGLIERARFG